MNNENINTTSGSRDMGGGIEINKLNNSSSFKCDAITIGKFVSLFTDFELEDDEPQNHGNCDIDIEIIGDIDSADIYDEIPSLYKGGLHTLMSSKSKVIDDIFNMNIKYYKMFIIHEKLLKIRIIAIDNQN